MNSKNGVSVVGMVGLVVLAVACLGCGAVSNQTIVPPPPISVSVSAVTTNLQAGGTTQLTATVSNDSANMGVTWSVACPTAPCGTVLPTTTASGIATTYMAFVPEPSSDLQVTITAISVSDPKAYNTVIITIPRISVTVAANLAKVEANATAQVTATVTNDTANKRVVWSASCSAPPCGTFSQTSTPSGIATTYTAPAVPPLSDLAVTITAGSVANPSATGSATVTIPAITISSAPAGALLLPENTTQQLTATVLNDPANAGVNWSLSQGGTACSPGCGNVVPSSTASGSSTTYTAPVAPPAQSSVTLTATSASDTTKSTSITITISDGTVKLVPNVLAFGSVVVNKNSSPQTVTLTNTENSALAISNITLAGTNAGDFSLTQTCGTSVGAESDCTLTVTFKPTAKGARNANIAITDSSAESPQQIGLSGTGATTTAAATGSALPLSLVGRQSATSPVPVGPDKIGTRVMDLTDSTRTDP